ncbi:unnamed protein product [Phytophthora lilii]|uniref:Unnamed protein product n=1 Tax=Phytophthora lilii TaxID=2077276 RepID=A0A9W6TAH8_9STRA|nr:unnamed protein product [Phytophthora lilii]
MHLRWPSASPGYMMSSWKTAPLLQNTTRKRLAFWRRSRPKSRHGVRTCALRRWVPSRYATKTCKLCKLRSTSTKTKSLTIVVSTRGQPEEAEKFFDDAIGAYEEHCRQASGSNAGEEDVSESDISLLADLNATAAMIHYHYAGNLLAQDRWEELKTVTEIALVLAENSSMPAEELEELQHCIHELWLEMD